MLRDIALQQIGTLRRVEIEHLHAALAQPAHAALEGTGLTDQYGRNAELQDQAAAVPAGRQRRDHDGVAIAALSPGISERIGFSVHRWIAVLHPAAVPGPQQPPS